MVVDVGVVKNHIKPKEDSTLYNMRKAELIEYIRTLEHNYNVAVSFNENQARYIESLDIAGIVRCKDCKSWTQYNACDGSKPHRCINYNAIFYKRTEPDCFCSYGERKDND